MQIDKLPKETPQYCGKHKEYTARLMFADHKAQTFEYESCPTCKAEQDKVA